MNPNDPYGGQSTPTGPSPYPRATLGRQPRREIDLAAIGEAWSVVSGNLVPFIVGGLVMMLIMGVLYAIYFAVAIGPMIAASATTGRAQEAAGMASTVVTMIGSIIMSVAMVVLTSLFTAGLMKMTLKALRGGKPEVADVFSGLQSNIPQIIVGSLIMGIAVGIGSQLCVIPGLILGGLLMLTIPLIVDRGLSAMDALKESWRLCSGNIVMASVIYILASLASGLGILACGIGLLVTMPLLYVTQAIVYEDLTADTMAPPGGYAGPESPRM